MSFKCTAAAVVLAGSLLPGAASAADPATPAPAMPAMPAGFPFAAAAKLDARVWVLENGAKREIPQSQTQVAKTNMQDFSPASMGKAMFKNAALSVLSLAAGPIGMVASSVFNMFGHHSQAKPQFHAVLALGGPQSQTSIASGATQFDCSYATTPGLNPDAYQPELIRLNVTKDNWRIVSISTSSDPATMAQFMMPAGIAVPNGSQPGSHGTMKLDEDRVAGASVTLLGRGQARITLAQPLSAGEYAIVLRPLGDTQDDSLPHILRAVWDFTV